MKEISLDENAGQLISGESLPGDSEEHIISLRPKEFKDYIGQKGTVEILTIAITASKKRGESLEHVLLHGPPGLGKTTLAHLIAKELGGTMTITSGPALEKGGDVLAILTHLEKGDVLFIDEIHRMPKSVEEFLYPAMEDFAVDFIFDKGPYAKSHRYRLNQFVMVGATTRVGLLSAPLRDRFGIFRSLDFYSETDLATIIKRSASILKVEINDSAATSLANRSRGTPRIANRLLRRVRDFAQVRGEGYIDTQIVHQALHLEGVDKEGLTPLDRRYLNTIINYYQGGPVGIEAIAATLQEEADTLVDVVEPFLLKKGFLLRTSAGRKTSAASHVHIQKCGFSE
jgi:Holliday junction DNA helicase RuvB